MTRWKQSWNIRVILHWKQQIPVQRRQPLLWQRLVQSHSGRWRCTLCVTLSGRRACQSWTRSSLPQTLPGGHPWSEHLGKWKRKWKMKVKVESESGKWKWKWKNESDSGKWMWKWKWKMKAKVENESKSKGEFLYTIASEFYSTYPQDVVQVLCLTPTTLNLLMNAFVHPYSVFYVVFISQIIFFLLITSIPIFILRYWRSLVYIWHLYGILF